MPREGHGSRNLLLYRSALSNLVMPREGHGSRNFIFTLELFNVGVMPREGHGSRNPEGRQKGVRDLCHAPRGAWE